MTPEEFVTQAREVLQQSLTQLQTATLLNSQLEQQILETGRSLQALSQQLEALSSSIQNERRNGQSNNS
ncbi:hypothetical protein [Leptolyngbya ohadii]|uniref:hypothetical protein n=1 Tax=Leptolyngbya ohadii TaxID=1962290 RepID=UPI000B5A0579|nr:hypothetical protein [Leptolyngbya ohadii]